METILLLGNANDHALRNTLLPALERYGGALYAGERQIFRMTSEQPAYFVYDCERLPELQIDRGVLLFKGSCMAKERLRVPEGVRCVADSGNRSAMRLLQEAGAPAITCGTSARDTLSAASLEYGRAVLSLQRSIVTLGGKLLEPHDFGVGVAGGSLSREILPVSLVLLLSGIDSGEGYVV